MAENAATFAIRGVAVPKECRAPAPPARLRDQPLVSCLCVTEGRAEFMPWLLWCFDRQTWRSRELVILDSSERPFDDSTRDDVRVVPKSLRPPGRPARRHDVWGTNDVIPVAIRRGWHWASDVRSDYSLSIPYVRLLHPLGWISTTSAFCETRVILLT